MSSALSQVSLGDFRLVGLQMLKAPTYGGTTRLMEVMKHFLN